MDREKNEVNNFVRKIKQEFSPAKVIFFGSRARNENLKYSDYDFIIVSERFKGVHWLDRISSVIGFWNLPYDIDLLPYTPEEFEKMKLQASVVRAAVKEGIVF